MKSHLIAQWKAFCWSTILFTAGWALQAFALWNWTITALPHWGVLTRFIFLVIWVNGSLIAYCVVDKRQEASK